MPLAGPSSGATFRMCRDFCHAPPVQTSKLQPTPQYVQTVFVRFTNAERVFDSRSDVLKIGASPVSGSTAFTALIMVSSTGFGRPVITPAWPSMEFSIRALQGQTVTQCPQE